MGLDSLEMIMDCEREFGIVIPDAAVVKVQTVGQFYDVVIKLVREAGKPELRARPDLEMYVFDRIRYFCVRPKKDFSAIQRATRFRDLGWG